MSLFEKAIKRNFADHLSCSDVVELLPLIYYSVEDVEMYIASLNLTHENLITIIGLCDLIKQLRETINFQNLLTDVAREQHHRQKTGVSHLLGRSSTGYICNDFDSALSVDKKAKIVISEIVQMLHLTGGDQSDFMLYQSELFDAEVYQNEIIIILCVVLHELPLMWSVSEVASGLLHCRRGLSLISALVLNFPHQWESVCRWMVHQATLANPQQTPKSTQGGHGNKSTQSATSSSGGGWVYRGAVRKLLHLNPQQTAHIMEFCLSEHKLPELTLDLALDLHKAGKLSILEFLKRVLLDEGPESRQWFTSYIRSSQSSSDRICLLNSQLILVARSFLPKLTEESLSTAQLFLKVMAALKGFTDYEFSPEMCSCLIELVTQRTPVSERAIQYISFSLAFFIGLRSCFIGDAPDSAGVEESIVSWLRYLLAEQDTFYSQLHTSYAELLLLLAIFFHTNQTSQIADLISGILGLKVSILSRNITALRKIFTHRVFEEHVITNQAALVPVTKTLNKNLTGHLPIHCVLQLLKTRSFTKNKVQIKDWIYHQLCNSVRPLHPLLPDLIEFYVKTVIIPHDRMGTTNDPITDGEISRAFTLERSGIAHLCAPASALSVSIATRVDSTIATNGDVDLTPQLLLLYYLLHYFDTWITSQAELIHHNRQTHKYSPKIWSEIPVGYLLRYVKKHLSDYRTLYPRLLKLVTSHLPHLVLGEYVMQDELLQDQVWAIDIPPKWETPLPSPKEVQLGFEQISTDTEGRLLSMLTALLGVTHPETLVPYCDPLIANIRLLLSAAPSSATPLPTPPNKGDTKTLPIAMDTTDDVIPVGLNRRVIAACRDLWLRLHLVMPRKLEVMTGNALRNIEVPRDNFLASLNCSLKKPWTQEDIIIDPVETLLMGVDDRVFRCPPLLETLLRVLDSSLVASRSWWEHRLIEKAPQDSAVKSSGRPVATPEEKERLSKSMLMSQDATVVQILLERCLPTPHEKDNSTCEISDLREIRRIICTFIHHLFISDPVRCHVVHWQTYPIELIPVTVQGIPSMHICLSDIINVFRTCADYGKMVFCINLISYLSAFYNINSAMEKTAILLEALQHIVTVVLSVEEKPSVSLPCLDAVVRISVTFPRLAPLVARFLLTLANQCRSQLAVYHHPIPSHFSLESEELEKLDINFDLLSLEERYKLCFVKSIAAYETLIQRSLVQRIAYHSVE